ncbi:MAG: hypothetical protein GEV00_00510 [Actinophytocola sp.]|nr:hypothetical protein [Actinophytocola sp.]
MGKLRRNVAAGATTMLVATSAMIAFPGSAAAVDPLVADRCGQTLKGAAGSPLSLDLASALGIPAAPKVNLGTVAEGTRTYSLSNTELADALTGISLLGTTLPKVCGLTVTGVDQTSGPLEDATQTVKKTADSLTGAVNDGTETVRKATEPVTDAVGGLLGGDSPGPGGEGPKSGPGPSDGPGKQTGDGGDSRTGSSDQRVPGPTSPPVERSASGYSAPYYSAFSPMSAFSSFPYRNASFYSHAPGLRYGSGFGDYAPSFGVLGQGGAETSAVSNAGSADALPTTNSRVGLPVLLAVLALAAASAGLVRTWVLRGIARSH